MKTLFFMSLLIGSVSFANRESGGNGRDGSQAIYVAFESIGRGIDSQTKEKLEELIWSAKAARLVLDETREQRGREGELLICVKVANAYARYNLIRGIATEILSDSRANRAQRTSVSLGRNCGRPNEAVRQDLRGYVN